MKNREGTGLFTLSGIVRASVIEWGQPCDLGQKCWRGVNHVLIGGVGCQSKGTANTRLWGGSELGLCGWCSVNIRGVVWDETKEVSKSWLVTSYVPGLVESVLYETLQGKYHSPIVQMKKLSCTSEPGTSPRTQRLPGAGNRTQTLPCPAFLPDTSLAEGTWSTWAPFSLAARTVLETGDFSSCTSLPLCLPSFSMRHWLSANKDAFIQWFFIDF